MTVVLQPAHHPIVGDVAPQQIAAVTKIDRAFSPAEAMRDALDRRIALALETFVQLFHAWVRIARIGEMAEGQVDGVDRHYKGSSLSRADISRQIK